MKEELLNRILKEHKKILGNFDIEHKRLAVCFSGVPACGKTYLSKKIEEGLKAVRLNNDEFRAKVLNGFAEEYELTKEDLNLCKDIFGFSDIDKVEREFGYTKNALKVDSILIRYMNWLELYYPFNNGLIIMDSNLGRKYEKLFSVLKRAGFEIFVVRMPFDRELFFEREMDRNKDVSFYMKNIERWEGDYLAYDGQIDFVFDGDVEKLLEAVGERLID